MPLCITDTDLLPQLVVADLHLSNIICNASIVTYQLSYLRQNMNIVSHNCMPQMRHCTDNMSAATEELWDIP